MVMVLVWTRPRFSVGGIRCQRWPPASCVQCWAAVGPVIRRIAYPGRASRSSASKAVAEGALAVDANLIGDEQFRVVPAFGRSNLDDHGPPHTSVRSTPPAGSPVTGLAQPH